ncbi:MAG: hypothetical protein V1649_01415 [Patescibacteria group bacterium]
MECKNVKCKEKLSDGTRFCSVCGWRQTEKIDSGYTSSIKEGDRIHECKHCNGTGECEKREIVGIKHSCEFCVQKAGIKSDNPFLLVPCGYCGGKGFYPIEGRKGGQQKEGGEKRINNKYKRR